MKSNYQDFSIFWLFFRKSPLKVFFHFHNDLYIDHTHIHTHEGKPWIKATHTCFPALHSASTSFPCRHCPHCHDVCCRGSRGSPGARASRGTPGTPPHPLPPRPRGWFPPPAGRCTEIPRTARRGRRWPRLRSGAAEPAQTSASSSARRRGCRCMRRRRTTRTRLPGWRRLRGKQIDDVIVEILLIFLTAHCNYIWYGGTLGEKIKKNKTDVFACVSLTDLQNR